MVTVGALSWVLCAAAALVPCGTSAVPPSSTVEQLHLALGPPGEAETLVLQWATSITMDPAAELCFPSEVHYGLDPAPAMMAATKAEATCFPFDLRNASFYAQANHLASLNVTAVGAKGGDTVFYSVHPRPRAEDRRAGSAPPTVYNLTVPPRSGPVEIGILGDLGTRTAGGEHVATALPAVHDAVAAGEIDWVFHLGEDRMRWLQQLAGQFRVLLQGLAAGLFSSVLFANTGRPPPSFATGVGCRTVLERTAR